LNSADSVCQFEEDLNFDDTVVKIGGLDLEDTVSQFEEVLNFPDTVWKIGNVK
jgi:hypothetical protein